jgi:hypothetical protein
MSDPRIEFLKKHLGVSDGVANATVHGGWPDVDSPDHEESPATKKTAKSYKHFKQDNEKELKAAFGPCDKLEEGVKEWHSDSHPVTKNEDGSPKTFYHGTNNEFTNFKETDSGYFFSEKPHRATEFAHHLMLNGIPGNAGVNVRPVHLKITNPFFANAKSIREIAKKMGHSDPDKFLANFEDSEHKERKTVTEWAKKNEHDGMVISRDLMPVQAGSDWGFMRSFVAFHPHQIKSVFAKQFDPKSTHISESTHQIVAKESAAGEHLEEAIRHSEIAVQAAINRDKYHSALTQEQMQSEADRYKDQFPEDHPGHADPKDLHWTYERDYPLHKIGGDRKEWKDWFKGEREDAAADGRRGYYDDMVGKNHEVHTAVVVHEHEGVGYLWDGNHRVGASHHNGKTTIPALVGRRKNTLPESLEDFLPDTKAWDEKSKSVRDPMLPHEDVKKFIENPNELDHFRVMAFNHAVWNKKLTHPEIEHYAANSDSKGVRRAASDLLKFSRSLVEMAEHTGQMLALEESRDDFMAKYGDAKHIHHAIDEEETEGVLPTEILQNPSFNREHHERLLNHKSPHVRNYAINSPHVTPDDLHKIIHDPASSVPLVNNAVMHDKVSVDDLKHVAMNYQHEYHESADKVRANAIHYTDKRNGWTVDELRSLVDHSKANLGKTKGHRTLIAAESVLNNHPDEILRKLQEQTEIPRIHAGIGQPESDWASYWLENKLVWVPKSDIIADAHETNEGLRHMGKELGEEFVLFEDGMVKTWAPHELAKELQLSQSVHEHYKNAGVTHYPYKDASTGVRYERITAVHRFNEHSRPVNDFLIRNFHGQKRSWDDLPVVAHHLDHIFDHGQKTTNPINTMSGLKQSPQDLIDHVRSLGHEIGDHIYMHLPAYTSTSTRFSTAAAFTKYFHPYDDAGKLPGPMNAHMFHIHVPTGHKLIGLEAHPDLENGHESELVLPRDTILKIKTTPNVYRIGNKHMHVWMSEVHGTNRTPLE